MQVPHVSTDAPIVESTQPPCPAPATLPPAPPALKPSYTKRFRPAGPPFFEILYGQNGKKIRVRLEVPKENEECPLTLGPIVEDSLEFLTENARWYPAFPDVKKMQLPCGHSFGALNILYHFARRNMLCPCCRSGVNSQLSIPCIPLNLRNILSAKVKAEIDKDEEEQIAADAAVAASAANNAFTIGVRYIALHESGNVRLIMCFHGADTVNNVVSIEVPLEAEVGIPQGMTAFGLPAGPYRTLIESQLSDESVAGFSLKTFMQSSSGRIFTLGSTYVVPINRQQNRVSQSIPTMGGISTFELDMINHQGRVTLTGLQWRNPVQLVSQEVVVLDWSD